MEDKSTNIVKYLENCGFQVAITPDYIVFKKGAKITFDLVKKELSVLKGLIFKKQLSYNFSELVNFELVTDERYADATPFQDGHKEFTYAVKLNLKNGKKLRLFEFIDRDKDGENYLAELMDIMKRTIIEA